jgi:uncharacterized glyoxalase superfamily protein PhnB
MIEFILYVANQEASKQFYEKLLNISPSLHVPGMTEFTLSDSCKLGLMSEEGIAKILQEKTPHPKDGNGIPRCELYLKVVNASEYIQRGLDLGAKEINPFQQRDWGDKVGYISDLDGHIIAFAEA